VQTLLPGPTETELEGADALGDRYDSPAVAVSASLAHLESGAPEVVSARGVLVQKLFAALIPARTRLGVTARMFRPYEDVHGKHAEAL
jgi:hypothetical protein